jgi:hypothetical protein
MGTLLLVAALSAAPEPAGPTTGAVVVLVVRRTSIDVAQGQQLAATAAAVLRKAGVAVEDPTESMRRLSVLGVTDPTQCGGRKACVLELLKQLECSAAVALSVSQVGQERSVAFEAWRTKDGALISKDAVVLKPDAMLDAASMGPFARVLAKAYPLETPPAAAGGSELKPLAQTPPVALTPEPKVDTVPAAVVVAPAPAPAPRSHVPGITLAVAAVAAASVAAAFGGAALTASERLNGGTSAGISIYQGSEAQKLASASNQRATVSGIAAGATVVLAVGAVLVW